MLQAHVDLGPVHVDQGFGWLVAFIVAIFMLGAVIGFGVHRWNLRKAAAQLTAESPVPVTTS